MKTLHITFILLSVIGQLVKMCLSMKCSPFLKQCFVTFGVTFNTLEQALVNGFSSVLVPQLMNTSNIEIDDESKSWIASIHNISMIFGALIVPFIMGRYGRKAANGLSAVILCITWLSLSLSSELYWILSVKLIQGLCCGMISITSSVTIGEYTSPKYRGAFLTTIALSYSFGMLVVHGLGSILSWQNTARVFAVITFLNCLIILNSPESPSFLASQGRFEECKNAFFWLRHSEEKDELEKLVKVNMHKIEAMRLKMNSKGCSDVLKRKIISLMSMFKKKEFCKPIIVMFHLHLINEWSGATIIDAYTTDIYSRIVGSEVNMSMLVISTDIQRVLTTCVAVSIIKLLRRRIMLITTVSLNIAVYILIAVYVFAKQYYGLSFDNSIIGVILIHLHVFSIASGCLPLPNIISGEIFALEYRGISNMIALMFFIVNVIVNSKTVLVLFSSIGLHGAYCIFAGFVAYGLVISWIMLPETKDKTLQDIEEKFHGKPLLIEKVTQPLVDGVVSLSLKSLP